MTKKNLQNTMAKMNLIQYKYNNMWETYKGFRFTYIYIVS